MAILFIRAEVDAAERRVPLSPEAVRQLKVSGHDVLVESSHSRVFDDEMFSREGCVITQQGAWRDLPRDAIVLGMKSLPANIPSIAQTHVYFAHAYDQTRTFGEKAGIVDLLRAFRAGGGRHLDFESLKDPEGSRLVASGIEAGRNATCMALLQWSASRSDPSAIDFAALIGSPYASLEHHALKAAGSFSSRPRCVVIGAAGRCGTGTSEVLQKAGIPFDRWDRADTSRADRGQRLGAFDIVFNCVSSPSAVEQFLTEEDVSRATRLSMLVDIGCEQSGYNPLKFYGEATSLEHPFKALNLPSRRLLVMAVDNLPSFTALESSVNFSRQLLPLMELLLDRGVTVQPWFQAEKVFAERIRLLSEEFPESMTNDIGKVEICRS